MILLCGLALARATSAGVAGTAVLEQPNAIVHDWVKRLGRGLYAVFGPVREAEWAPDWSPRFIHLAQGRTARGRRVHYGKRSRQDRLWLFTTYDARNGQVE